MQREQKTKHIDELTDKQLEDVIGGMTREAFNTWRVRQFNKSSQTPPLTPSQDS